MKLSKWYCGLALAGSLVATDAFAYSDYSGLEGIVSISASILAQDIEASRSEARAVVVVPKDNMVGLSGTLAIGYRFEPSGGIYLEQDLGGIWWTGDTKKHNDNTWFIGGTYITGRAKIAFLPKHTEFDVKLGVGMMYTDGGRYRPGKAKYNLITDKENYPTVAFALKAGVSFSYYVTSNIGIGIQFDYSFGLNMHDHELGGDVVQYLHHMVPGAHIRFGF